MKLCRALLLLVLPATALAQTPPPNAKLDDTLNKGLMFLKAKENPDGTWQGPQEPPAISALVLRGFVQNGAKADPDITKGFEKLLTFQQPDGGIYNGMLANYNTAICVTALATMGDTYKTQEDKAVAFLKGLQWNDQGEDTKERKKVDAKDPRFGGVGYGRSSRPDLSNLQMTLDALHDAGVQPSDPAYQNAIKFVTRTQNDSETNDQPWAGNDGGFIYTPANDGSSAAGEYTDANGKKMFRSYGSMTYAGLKSFIYAGVSKDDPKVKAAWNWIASNWTLDQNPGMGGADPATGASGLYYYFHTLGRALNAYDESTITDKQGNKHDWRIELIDKLTALQKPDGSWVGEKRWMETNPVLVTAYCVLALEEAKADLAEHPAK